MTRLRLAVIGAGHLGRIHTSLANTLDEFDVVGVVDPSNIARQRATEELGIETFASRDKLLGGFVDAAVVATPTALHHEIGLELLQNGVHVLMEKPLCRTALEADELVAAADRNGVILQVGHIEQFNPAFEAIRPFVDGPKYIESVRTSGYTFRSMDIGVVLDLMIHDLDIILSLVRSPVTEVHALGISLMGQHEDMAQARLSFQNGCVANLSASRTSFHTERTMQLYGEQAFATIDFAVPSARCVRPSSHIRERKVNVAELPVKHRQYLKEHLFDELLPIEDLQIDPCNALLEELTDFAASILEHRAPRVTGRQGRQAIAVAERILQQIEAHRWNGDESGPVGPFAQATRPVLSSPAWDKSREDDVTVHRRAG